MQSWKSHIDASHVISQDLPDMRSSTASESPLLPGKARRLLVSHYRLMPRQHQGTVVKARVLLHPNPEVAT